MFVAIHFYIFPTFVSSFFFSLSLCIFHQTSEERVGGAAGGGNGGGGHKISRTTSCLAGSIS
mgnify:CR=1 FL=1